MTGKEIKQYIEDLGHEPRHNVDAISHAANEVAYLYQSKTNPKQVIEFMLADKPILNLATHSYGFHSRSGRGLRELFTENYNSYLRNNVN